jgi:uncharacterized protein
MNEFRFIRILLPGFCLLTVLSGCIGGTSPPAKFYTLAQMEADSAPVKSGADCIVLVGPVSIPDYLDQRQIVTRSGSNELVINEFNRWGGSFDSEITHALVAGISKQLASRNAAVLPWKAGAIFSAGNSYRMPVQIERFDGSPGGSVVLILRWEIVAKGKDKEEAFRFGETTIIEKVDGTDYEALVAAMQRALGKAGKEMADGIIAAKGP